MPSVVELAELSLAVYSATGAPAGWTREKVYSVASAGFYAAMFTSNSGETVLAIRGTDGMDDLVDDYSIFAGRVPTQIREATRALQNARTLGGVVYLTGHSLGGGLASYLAARHNYPCVTFNAPGMVRTYSRRLKARSQQQEWNRDKILHIRAKYDVVSVGTGRALGSQKKTVTIKSCSILPVSFALCQHSMKNMLEELKNNQEFSQPFLPQ
jgi:pimeloyl-ACP methyl ester carboxylesterase